MMRFLLSWLCVAAGVLFVLVHTLDLLFGGAAAFALPFLMSVYILKIPLPYSVPSLLLGWGIWYVLILLVDMLVGTTRNLACS